MKKTQFTLQELTEGLDVVIKGDIHSLIHGVQTIQQARAGDITFLNNSAYRKFLPATNATAVILSSADANDCPGTAVITSNPYYIYSKIASFFDDHPKSKPGIHPTAVIGENCQIAPTVSIGPQCVIGDHVTLGESVRIGAGCVIGEYTAIDDYSELHAHVTIYHKIKIGKRVVIASGVVLGSDGFGLSNYQGQWQKVPQIGTVIIEDDVEIGANCAIDRGAIGDTILKKGVKLDNLIQIAHNVIIGENTAIAGCVGIAGSTIIGKNCMIGGGTGFAGHLTITDQVMITGMTAVTKSISKPGVYSSGVGGLMTNKVWRKNSAYLNRIEQLVERVKNLESKIREEE